MRLSGSVNFPSDTTSVVVVFPVPFSVSPKVSVTVRYEGILPAPIPAVSISGLSVTQMTVHIDTEDSDGGYFVDWFAPGDVEEVTSALPLGSLPVVQNPAETSYVVMELPDATTATGKKTALVPLSAVRNNFLRLSDPPASNLSPGVAHTASLLGNFLYFSDGVKWGRIPVYFSDWNFKHHFSQVQTGDKNIPSAATSVNITFDQPFSQVPTINGLVMVYTGSGVVPFHNLTVSAVSKTGFTVNIYPAAVTNNLRVQWEARNVKPEDTLYNTAPFDPETPNVSIEVTSDYTISVNDSYIMVDATDGPVTITLPLVADFEDAVVLTILKSDFSLNEVIIQRSGSDLINGTETTINLGVPGYSLKLTKTSGWLTLV